MKSGFGSRVELISRKKTHSVVLNEVGYLLNIHIMLQVLANLGATDIDSRLEEQLIDGILFAFQEQTNEVIN